MKPRRRKCKHCGEYYLPKSSLLEPCPNYECRLILWNKANKKLAAQAKKKQREERKKFKEQNTDYSKLLQKEINKIARLIDYKCLCLARNIVPIKKDGGHLFSSGGNRNMTFNLHNIFLQSAASNHYQSDDLLLRDGVVRVFGSDYLDFITSLKSTPIQKYTNEDYKLFLQKARQISKQLTEWNNYRQMARAPLSRIQMRNWANTELSIYPCEFLNF